jgi:hypothetical protein
MLCSGALGFASEKLLNTQKKGSRYAKLGNLPYCKFGSLDAQNFKPLSSWKFSSLPHHKLITFGSSGSREMATSSGRSDLFNVGKMSFPRSYCFILLKKNKLYAF